MKRSSLRIGFTLVELLVVIAIIALLISILLPSLNKARDAAKSVTCASNLRQMGIGAATYAANNRGWLPPPAYSGGSAIPFLMEVDQFKALFGQLPDVSLFSVCPTLDPHASYAGVPLWGPNSLFNYSTFKYWSVGYAFVANYDRPFGTGAGYPQYVPETAGKMSHKARNVVAADLLFRRLWNWKDAMSAPIYFSVPTIAHRDLATGKPRGGHTLFADGSVSWIKASSLGPKGLGVDGATDFNYDYQGPAGSRSLFWGVDRYR